MLIILAIPPPQTMLRPLDQLHLNSHTHKWGQI